MSVLALSHDLSRCCVYSLKGCGRIVSAALGTASIAQHATPLPSTMLQTDLCADVLVYVDADDRCRPADGRAAALLRLQIAQASRAQSLTQGALISGPLP